MQLKPPPGPIITLVEDATIAATVVTVPEHTERPTYRRVFDPLTVDDTIKIVISVNDVEIDTVTYNPQIADDLIDLLPVVRMDIVESAKEVAPPSPVVLG